MKCTSCGTDSLARKNFVRFMCPNCMETEIVRCFNCKVMSNRYECVKCKFIGP
ncbi:MAG TPA: zinc finger domain-containing protein [archaeon]|nr:zinc finger domain-containing protein [archaeon]